MNSRVPIFDHQLVKSAPAVLGDVPPPSDDLAQVYRSMPNSAASLSGLMEGRTCRKRLK
jgi:hypothetical protein